MAYKLLEAGVDPSKKKPFSTIAVGTVVNNCDLIKQGKVTVRIPSMDMEVSARLSGPGGGDGAGFCYIPRPDDEVLLGLTEGDPVDAYIINGLWSTSSPPPVSDPITAPSKRVLKTGLKAGMGHEVEFDDLKQSISITSSTKQKIIIEPTKIVLSTTGGQVEISMDLKGIKLTGLVSIELSAPQIKLNGASVEINGKLSTTIKGGKVFIN